MSSGGGTTVSTSEVQPWEAQRDYLEKGFASAKGLYGAGAPKYYSAPTVASFDPSETAAQRATIGYTTGPRAAAQQAAAENALIGSLGGQTGFDPTQTQNLLAGATDVRGGMPFTDAQRASILAGEADPLGGMPFSAAQRASILAGETDVGGGMPFTDAQRASILAGETDALGGTPFSAAQMSDILAGNVRTGSGTPFGAMEDALTRGVMDNLTGRVLPGIREAQVRYQPGGGTRSDLTTNKAITDAVQAGLMKPLAEMYGGAYQQAQGMRQPLSDQYSATYRQAQSMRQALADQYAATYRQAQDMRQPFADQYATTYRQAQGMRQPLADQYAATYRDAQNRRLPAAELGIQQRQYGQQMYPSIMNAPLGMYNAMGGVGEQRRAMSQEGIDQDMARYQYESNAGQNALRNYMAMVTGDYGSTTTSTTPAPKDNTIANLIGTLGSAYLMAGSDIHVKENIIPEGTKWKGLNVYNYNYIGDSTPRRGVMAQQVEGIYPDAVTTINGVKHVNYGAI